jgi:hypothetical protein
MSITIYKDSKFNDKKITLKANNYPTVPGLGNDEISSIKVEKGSYVELFRDTGYRGNSIFLFEGEYSKLPGWNDEVSSLKVKNLNGPAELYPLVEFYEDDNYGGFKQSLAATGQNDKYDFPFFKNDSISSLRIPKGVKVSLYDKKGLVGDHKEFGPDIGIPSLGVYGYNDKVSSVQLTRPGLEVIDVDFSDQELLETGSPVTIESLSKNYTDQTNTANISLERRLSKSVTRTWSESIARGFSISVSVTVKKKFFNVDTEIEIAISSHFEKTTTIGGSETETDTFVFKKGLSVTLPPHSITTASIILTPKKYQVTAKYTLRIMGTDTLLTEYATIIIDDYLEGVAEISNSPITDVALEQHD